MDKFSVEKFYIFIFNRKQKKIFYKELILIKSKAIDKEYNCINMKYCQKNLLETYDLKIELKWQLKLNL